MNKIQNLNQNIISKNQIIDDSSSNQLSALNFPNIDINERTRKYDGSTNEDQNSKFIKFEIFNNSVTTNNSYDNNDNNESSGRSANSSITSGQNSPRDSVI